MTEASADLVGDVDGPVSDAETIRLALDRYRESTPKKVRGQVPTITWSASGSDTEMMTNAGQVLTLGSRIESSLRALHAECTQRDELKLSRLNADLDNQEADILAWRSTRDGIQARLEKTKKDAVPYHAGAIAVTVVVAALALVLGLQGMAAGLLILALYVAGYYSSVILSIYRATRAHNSLGNSPQKDSGTENKVKQIERDAQSRELALSQFETVVQKRAHKITPWSPGDLSPRTAADEPFRAQ
ncbi:hypothetical protein [Nocardia noduli]|uniref:hypothetical protein n=1 Tax=Nocardia noduli TaxID=2815722 RepID=UPI001C251303|nr:hypothetical protein [Nocardia noduli]